MVKYLKSSKKSRITKNKTKKNKTKKDKKIKKMIGGTIEELDGINPEEKTIILMGELHTVIYDRENYDKIIKKQKKIINTVIQRIGKNKTAFYTEVPNEVRDDFMIIDTFNSSIIAQFVDKKKIPIKFSSVSFNDRTKCGDCNDKYARDILDIFEKNKKNETTTV